MNNTENNREKEFDWHKDTPFYEVEKYDHRVGNGEETFVVDKYTEEEKIEWLKNN